jgi:hypothetical protein
LRRRCGDFDLLRHLQGPVLEKVRDCLDGQTDQHLLSHIVRKATTSPGA